MDEDELKGVAALEEFLIGVDTSKWTPAHRQRVGCRTEYYWKKKQVYKTGIEVTPAHGGGVFDSSEYWKWQTW